ncbi:MAG: peroxiredoxin [Devosia sp.]
MPELSLGQRAPDITLPTDDGGMFRLAEHRKKPVVLTFYSDGTTEGCAIQNREFSDLMPEFGGLGAMVVAIAPQPAKACASFREKYGLGQILAADPDLKTLKAYGLWAEKKLYGHVHMGVLRTSIIVDGAGKIAAILRATRIKGHAQKVLDAVRALVTG